MSDPVAIGVLPMPPESLAQLGALGIVVLFTIKELFAYLKAKAVGVSPPLNKEILDELKLMNSNHLHSIEDAINEGNKRLIDSQHADSMKVVEILGEIKGNLTKHR